MIKAVVVIDRAECRRRAELVCTAQKARSRKKRQPTGVETTTSARHAAAHGPLYASTIEVRRSGLSPPGGAPWEKGAPPRWTGTPDCGAPRIAGAVCASAGAIIVDCCTAGGGGIVCVIIAGTGIGAGCGTGSV